jgi:hypothetical protein
VEFGRKSLVNRHVYIQYDLAISQASRYAGRLVSADDYSILATTAENLTEHGQTREMVHGVSESVTIEFFFLHCSGCTYISHFLLLFFSDVFVMIFMLVSFRVSFSSPSRTYLPNDIYTVDMMLAPLFGMYANMTAQLVTQLSSHYILHFQRRIEAAANEKYISMSATEANDSMEIEEFIIADDRSEDQVENGDSEEVNRSSERNSTHQNIANNVCGY